jgi:adenosylcobinamide-GDP ribazoletransferase
MCGFVRSDQEGVRVGADWSGDCRRRLATGGAAFGASLRFLTRLPVPTLGPDDDFSRLPDLARQAWAFPLAGAVVGLLSGATFWLASWIGLAGLPAAALAIAAGIVATGALHEDGLADTADGLAAGGGTERRLSVMRDSRIGAAGATALVLSIVLRVAALSAISEVSAGLAAAVLVAANAASRAAALAPMTLLAPARSDGIGVAAGRPSRSALAAASCIAAAFAVILLIPFGNAVLPLAGMLAAAVAALVVVRAAATSFGGGTGDVAGAAEQAAAIAFLLAAAAAVS